MSPCAKPLGCDTHLRVSRSLCSLENYSLTENQSLLRMLFDKDTTYFKFANDSDRLWGWTRFLRASGASEQRLQYPSYTYTIYCLPYISCYYLTSPAISDHTLHCTVWKYYYLCKTIDRLDTFTNRQFDKDFGSSGCHEYFNVPMCQTVGLWHSCTRPSLAVLARKL